MPPISDQDPDGRNETHMVIRGALGLDNRNSDGEASRRRILRGKEDHDDDPDDDGPDVGNDGAEDQERDPVASLNLLLSRGAGLGRARQLTEPDSEGVTPLGLLLQAAIAHKRAVEGLDKDDGQGDDDDEEEGEEVEEESGSGDGPYASKKSKRSSKNNIAKMNGKTKGGSAGKGAGTSPWEWIVSERVLLVVSAMAGQEELGELIKIVVAGSPAGPRAAAMALSRADAFGNLPLHHAAAALNGPTILRLMRLGASPAEVSRAGRTALHEAVSPSDPLRSGYGAPFARIRAARAQDLAAVIQTLCVGVDPSPANVGDITGATPLHLAASLGDLLAVEALLAAGCDPLAANQEGRFPLACVPAANDPVSGSAKIEDPVEAKARSRELLRVRTVLQAAMDNWVRSTLGGHRTSPRKDSSFVSVHHAWHSRHSGDRIKVREESAPNPNANRTPVTARTAPLRPRSRSSPETEKASIAAIHNADRRAPVSMASPDRGALPPVSSTSSVQKGKPSPAAADGKPNLKPFWDNQFTTAGNPSDRPRITRMKIHYS